MAAGQQSQAHSKQQNNLKGFAFTIPKLLLFNCVDSAD